MKCKACDKDFSPSENASVGSSDGDAIEVRTECTECGVKYYTFTTAACWVQEEHFDALLAIARSKNK